MDKKELTQSLKNFTGAGVITKAKLCEFMGITHQRNVNKYLAGLMALDGKYYLVSDVAARLWERTRS